MQKRMKKGFTLAELLIVVAIIAVLVAIAVPLFVGSLGDAEEAVYNANRRSVKSAAVAYILSEEVDISTADGDTNVIIATGTFSEDGSDFEKVVVKVDAKASNPVTDLATWKADKTTLVVYLTATEVSGT